MKAYDGWAHTSESELIAQGESAQIEMGRCLAILKKMFDIKRQRPTRTTVWTVESEEFSGFLDNAELVRNYSDETHASMNQDARRNQAYREAIQRLLEMGYRQFLEM